MKAKITESLVERKDLQGLIYDTELRGFGLYVFPSGRKRFFVQYGPSRSRRRFYFGEWPMMPAGEARRQAMAILASVARGEDPVAAKKEVRKAEGLTLKDWVEHYLKEVTARKKQPRHDAHALRRAVRLIGNRPLVKITPQDVQRAMSAVQREAAKNPRAKASGGPPGATSANRWLASIRACLEVAKRRGLLADNPAAAVERLPEPIPRDRVLSDGELARLGEVLASWPDPVERAAILLLMETGARASELLHARWEDFDLDAQPPYWRIPSPKAGKPQVVPLTPRAVSILQELPRLGEYIIPGRWPNRPRESLLPIWRKIRQAAGITDARLHDIRRTFGLHIAAQAGIFVASKLLRHSDPRITARVYAPLGLGDLAEVLAKTGTPGDVLAFRKKGNPKG